MHYVHLETRTHQINVQHDVIYLYIFFFTLAWVCFSRKKYIYILLNWKQFHSIHLHSIKQAKMNKVKQESRNSSQSKWTTLSQQREDNCGLHTIQVHIGLFTQIWTLLLSLHNISTRVEDPVWVLRWVNYIMRIYFEISWKREHRWMCITGKT